MTHSRPFTADSLAERWGCSGETVRQMVKSGACGLAVLAAGIAAVAAFLYFTEVFP